MKDFLKLEKELGIDFKDHKLLKKSLTHRSYINENPKTKSHNERLEFLGDAVLELIVTEYLFKNYKEPEGELTSWRAALVNSEMLASVSLELGLGNYLLLSRGEEKDLGRARDYILANAFEALLGAIYIDRGMEVSRSFVENNILDKLDMVLEKGLHKDSKSSFQEKAQEKVNITPYYKVLDEWGPDHQKEFKIGVYLGDELVAEAEGASKAIAEKEAAKKALEVKKW
jgi:ribonuclease III